METNLIVIVVLATLFLLLLVAMLFMALWKVAPERVYVQDMAETGPVLFKAFAKNVTRPEYLAWIQKHLLASPAVKDVLASAK